MYHTCRGCWESFQFHCLVMSDCLRYYGLQHTKLPCPSPSPGACSNSYPLSRWCHPTTSHSIVTYYFCLQWFQWIFRTGFLQDIQVGSPCCPRDYQESSPTSQYLGLISFSIDGLDFLAVQGTLKSLLQHHSSKASILKCSVFFIVQHSYAYMTTGKTIAFTRWIFIRKVRSLLFNMLSRLFIREGNDTPLQYSCLENPMDRGAW